MAIEPHLNSSWAKTNKRVITGPDLAPPPQSVQAQQSMSIDSILNIEDSLLLVASPASQPSVNALIGPQLPFTTCEAPAGKLPTEGGMEFYPGPVQTADWRAVRDVYQQEITRERNVYQQRIQEITREKDVYLKEIIKQTVNRPPGPQTDSYWDPAPPASTSTVSERAPSGRRTGPSDEFTSTAFPPVQGTMVLPPLRRIYLPNQ